MNIGALVLAAGQSRRFGGDKRQAALPNGKLVIQQTLEKVTALFDDVLVVLRAEDTELHKRLKTLFADIRYYHAPDSELGMGNSLASGVRQLEGCDGVFVFLGDMPFAETSTLEQLKNKANTHSIIVPGYDGKPGHPVGFGSAFFAELTEISGDRGARTVINNHEDAIVVVEVEDAGVLQDIDHSADLEPQ